LNYANQNRYNRIWGLLASASLKDLLTPADRDELILDLQHQQHDDGGWSLEQLGPWRWDRTTPPFESPGPRDLSLAVKSDGYATGLIVYALRQAGMSLEVPIVRTGLQWLRANQVPVRVGDEQ